MNESPGAARVHPPAKVAALLPLAILESVRRHDRPRETLEDENLAESLPRRLGLTDVIESQIHRYELARKRGNRIPGEEVHDLLRLVLRRPDAETILLEAGRWMARSHYDGASPIAAAARRVLPRRIAASAARRAARRVLGRLAGVGSPEISGPPLTVRIPNAVTASVDADGTACALVSGLLEELIALYTGGRAPILHRHCEARGAEACEWAIDT